MKERYNKIGRNLKVAENKDANLVIPKKLSPQELIDAVENHVQGMSKKKRKRLEKFVLKKKKKLRRAELLEDLKHSSVVDSEFSKTSRLGQKERKLRNPLEVEELEVTETVETTSDNAPIEIQLHDLPKTPMPAPQSLDFSTKRPLDPNCKLGQADDLEIKETRKYKIPNRSKEIDAARNSLPIIQYEHDIMEHLMNNDVVVVCGATGSGKTTQVGQFCWEYGYSLTGKICCTQPRKVGAISVANRVQEELLNCKVGFKVRHESNIDPSTELVYMTDGILLKEMMTDLLINKYSVVIIDEAHERNINTDILIGLLSRVVKLRRSNYEKKQGTLLKLIIMSATLRIHDFTENTKLFATPPPVINVPARIHPVIVHFNRITPTDYISASVHKIINIHETYPPGGILVFVSGQKEVELVCQLLNQKYGNPLVVDHPQCIDNDLIEVEDLDLIGYSQQPQDAMNNDDEEPIAIVGGQLTEEEKHALLKTGEYGGDVVVLPLFSVLSNKEQAKCFQPVNDTQRLIVVATNIAETSITIPNIKYVVDSGKVKTKTYHQETGMYQFKVQWTSKASAEQRMGRCGRTQPGHCFRLYSSTVFEHQFIQYSLPEIVMMPIENVILHLKSIGIDNIQNFPFPTNPSSFNIQQGLELLKILQALDTDYKITSDGLLMSKFPLNARFSRILVSCMKHHALRYAVTLVAILSAQPFQTDKELTRRLKSDMLNKLFIVCGIDYQQHNNALKVPTKILNDIVQIRLQLIKMLNTLLVNGFQYDVKLTPPSLEDLAQLKKGLLCGFLDQVAVPVKCLNNSDDALFTNIMSHQGVNCGLPVTVKEIVVYSDLINKYANNATIMPLGWLGPASLHCFTRIEFIKEPVPTYNKKLDTLMGYVSGQLPGTSYKPPIFQVDLNEHLKDVGVVQRYLIFLLLSGSISEPFKCLKKYLITQPHVFINNTVHVSKVVNLMHLVKQHDIRNLRDLCKQFDKDHMFLLAEILAFYSESSHQYLRALWPPFKYDDGMGIKLTQHSYDIIKSISGDK